MKFIRDFITGFLIGLANLIPGVSGGTFALILGIYERLIHFLNSVGPKSIMQLVQLCSRWLGSGLRRDKRDELHCYLRENDYPFMAVIGLGALVCILAMSSLMKYLLLNHFTYTYGFFFGLIVLSIGVPWRMIRKLRLPLILPMLAGVILTVGVTAAVNPYDKALNKSQLLEKQYQSQQEVAREQPDVAAAARFSFIGKYTSGEYVYIFFCGVIAISAMVLPGISGSLVLILMNQYFAVISAVANIRALLLDDLLFLACMGGGIVFGLLSFSRIIDFALRKFHDSMISFLVGLIAGSLYSLWPFKQTHVIDNFYVKEGAAVEVVKNHIVHSNVNILPTDTATALLTGAAVIIGMFIMLLFLRQEKSAASK